MGRAWATSHNARRQRQTAQLQLWAFQSNGGGRGSTSVTVSLLSSSPMVQATRSGGPTFATLAEHGDIEGWNARLRFPLWPPWLKSPSTLGLESARCRASSAAARRSATRPARRFNRLRRRSATTGHANPPLNRAKAAGSSACSCHSSTRSPPFSASAASSRASHRTAVRSCCTTSNRRPSARKPWNFHAASSSTGSS